LGLTQTTKPNGIASLAGEQLKALRHRLGVTTRQVEGLSRQVADAKNNPQFFISHAWLTDIENGGGFAPSIFKLYSLSMIYRFKFEDMLAFFGLDLSKATKEMLSIQIPTTHLIGKAVEVEGESLSIPADFGPSFKLAKTSLLSRMVESWGKIPVSMVAHLNFGKALYGYIGLDDFTLYPLVRPGSFVEIDSRQNKINPAPWRSEFDRPIYFVEVRDACVCSWCELDGDQLTAVPHPESKQEVRRFQYPAQAEIVGRVVSVAMRIVDADRTNPQ
jgi:transcriptional regulator with XRE-family HTH domain